MRDHPIERRTLLECAVRLLAVPAGLEFLSAWGRAAQQHGHVAGVAAPPQPLFLSQYRPQFFSQSDFDALQALTELLIPTDETPGAREACCSQFIDFLLHSSGDFASQTQQQWRSAMSALREAGFHSATAQQRAALLVEISRPERDPSAQHPAYFAYRLIKRENAFAFYTARAGIVDDLDYRGNSYNVQFPACTHPEHQEL